MKFTDIICFFYISWSGSRPCTTWHLDARIFSG